MNTTVGLLKWLFKAAVFFALFAFALNNLHPVTLHFAFGRQWHAPMALVMLMAFAAGLAAGVMGMLSGRWRQRRQTPSTSTTETDHGA